MTCPNCVNAACDAFDANLDDELFARVGWVREVDRAVDSYERKRRRGEFTDFEALLPESVRDRGLT